jgi:hypothetical protein
MAWSQCIPIVRDPKIMQKEADRIPGRFKTNSKMARSQSIPIVRDPKIMQEEADEESNSMMADYQDYIFYTRLLNGIEERQKAIRHADLRYQDGAHCDLRKQKAEERQKEKKHADLRYQNEALINNIKCTRHCDLRDQKANHYYRYITCDSAREEDCLCKTLKRANAANSEDEMMFEMDM